MRKNNAINPDLMGTKQMFSNPSSLSICNKEADVNIETRIGKYPNLYEFWKDHYIAPNTTEYYLIGKFMADNGKGEILEAAKNVYNRETEETVPTIVLKYNGKVVVVLRRVPIGVDLSDTAEWSIKTIREWSEDVQKEQKDTQSKMSVITLDVMDAVFAIWVRRKEHPEAFVEINIDEILEYLGLQKLPSGNRRRGGYRKEQREMIRKQLRLLASTWAEAEGIEYKNKKRPVKLKSPLILIGAEKHYLDDDSMVVKVCPGDLMRHALLQGFYAVMPRTVLRLHAKNDLYEKRALRFLWREYRINQQHGESKLEFTVGTLMKEIGLIDPNEDPPKPPKYPKTTKEKFEEILSNTVGEFGFTWMYQHGWDDSEIENRYKWWNDYLGVNVIINIPDEIFEYYQANIKTPETQLKKKEVSELGVKLREAMKLHGINRFEASKEIGIDEITLYRIISGRTKNPTKIVREKCEKWLKKVEQK